MHFSPQPTGQMFFAQPEAEQHILSSVLQQPTPAENDIAMASRRLLRRRL